MLNWGPIRKASDGLPPMTNLIYITHPDVVQDPEVLVPQWTLSERGRERMAAMLHQEWVSNIGTIYSSMERKSLDGAEILARHLGLPFTAVADLGEIDRSATGFLPDAEHAALGRACFEQPDVSVRGWETANHAQARVASAVEQALRMPRPAGDIAFIGHGGVGTLLLCHLTGRPISLSERPPGATGGYCFIYDINRLELVSGWKRIDEPPLP